MRRTLVVVLAAGPVALVLKQHLDPSDGDSTGLNHALDSHVMSLLGGAGGSVSDDVHIVAEETY